MSGYIEIDMPLRNTLILSKLALAMHEGDFQKAVLQLTCAIMQIINDEELPDDYREIAQRQVVELVGMHRIGNGDHTITLDETSGPTIVPETKQ